MALADLIKACSLSDSSLKGSSAASTTTQVVGLLSVLAISGSVALFTLGGKLKLTGEEALGPLTRADESGPLKKDGRDGLMRAEEEEEEAASEPLKTEGRDDREKARRRRVRFADDVVEPRGNSEEYRQRFAERQQEEQGSKNKRRTTTTNSIPANRMALYRGLRQHRLQHSSSASFFS